MPISAYKSTHFIPDENVSGYREDRASPQLFRFLPKNSVISKKL